MTSPDPSPAAEATPTAAPVDDAAAKKAANKAAKKTAKKAKKRGRLRRWLVRLFVVAIVLRVALALSLTSLVEYGIGFAGLDATCQSASLSLLGGSVRLQQVTVIDPRKTSESARCNVDEIAADLSTWQLLFGEIAISDVVLRGIDIEVHLAAEGSPILPTAWEGPAEPEPEPEPPAEEPAGPVKIELPFSIATARIHDLRLRIVDPDPEQSIELVLDADIDDVGRRDIPGHLELRLASEGIADRIVFDATIDAQPDRFACDWMLLARGLDLGRFAPEAAAGIEPLDFILRGDVGVDPERSTPESTVLALNVDLDRSPALARVLKLQASTTLHKSGATDITSSLAAEDVTLRPLQPLLQAAGIAIEGDGVDLNAEATAAIGVDGGIALHLRDVRIGKPGNVVALESLQVERLLTTAGSIDVAAIRAKGPTGTVFRLPDGSMTCAGLRILAGAPSATEPPPEPPDEPATAPPAIVLRDIDWRGVALTYVDHGLPDSPALAVSDLSLVGKGLAFFCDREQGSATLSLAAPGIAENVTTELRIKPREAGGELDVEFASTGVTLAKLIPWLKPAGITPTFTAGQLKFGLHVDLAEQDDAPTLSARLANLRVTDGEEVLVSLRNVELREFLPGDERLAFAALSIDEPFVRIDNNPDAMKVAGLSFAATPAAAGATTAAPAIGSPGSASSAANAANAAPMAIETGPINVRSATVRLLDPRRRVPDVTIGLDVELGAMAGSGRDAWAKPVPFSLAVHLQQQLETLSLRGEGSRAGDELSVTGRLEGTGIRGSAFEPFLPDLVRSPLQNGRIEANLTAKLVSKQMGTELDCTIRDLLLHDGELELAAIDLLEIDAPMLGRTEVHIASLQIDGLRALVTSTPDGLLVPGLLLENDKPVEPAVADPAAGDPQAVAPSAADPTAQQSGNPTPTPTTRPADPVLPRMQLDKVIIASNGIVWRDRRGADGVPLETSFRLELKEPWATAAELDATPPMRWTLGAAVTPIVQQVTMDLSLSPFELEPELKLELAATGIDTIAIERMSPTLAKSVRGTESNATLEFALHAQLNMRRSSPAQFDFSRAFGGSLQLERLTLNSDTGEALVQIPLLDAEMRAFDPSTGDLLLRSVDLEAPKIRAIQSAEGLAVAGILLPTPPPPEGAEKADPAPESTPTEAVATAPAEAPTQPAPPSTGPATGPAARGQTAAKPGPEVAVDDLNIYGLGLDYRDTTTDPPTLLPIDELDLQVQRFSTRSLTEARPFAFRTSIRGGAVPLEKRVVSSSLLAGLVSATTDLVTGASNKHELEERPLVDEIRVQGHLQLFPFVKGHIESSIRALELSGLRGLVKGSGVEIGDGVYDSKMTIDLGSKGVELRGQNTFTWLQISEPPNGPISTYLKLPAPLDTVLFVLRNDNDEQRIPIQFKVPTQGVGTGAIAEAAVEALTLLISDAIASSPFRVGRILTDAVGLSGRKELKSDPVALPCIPGSAQPTTFALLKPLQELYEDEQVAFVLSHELSQADLDRAEVLANPDLEIAGPSVARLRDELQTIQKKRKRLATDVIARLLAGQVHSARPRVDELQAVDNRLAEVQSALDQAMALFDGNTPRHRRQRTRAAALELGQLRLNAVQQELAGRLGKTADIRIEVRPPRSVITAGLPAGGRIVVTPKLRAL